MTNPGGSDSLLLEAMGTAERIDKATTTTITPALAAMTMPGDFVSAILASTLEIAAVTETAAKLRIESVEVVQKLVTDTMGTMGDLTMIEDQVAKIYEATAASTTQQAMEITAIEAMMTHAWITVAAEDEIKVMAAATKAPALDRASIMEMPVSSGTDDVLTVPAEAAEAADTATPTSILSTVAAETMPSYGTAAILAATLEVVAVTEVKNKKKIESVEILQRAATDMVGPAGTLAMIADRAATESTTEETLALTTAVTMGELVVEPEKATIAAAESVLTSAVEAMPITLTEEMRFDSRAIVAVAEEDIKFGTMMTRAAAPEQASRVEMEFQIRTVESVMVAAELTERADVAVAPVSTVTTPTILIDAANNEIEMLAAAEGIRIDSPATDCMLFGPEVEMRYGTKVGCDSAAVSQSSSPIAKRLRPSKVPFHEQVAQNAKRIEALKLKQNERARLAAQKRPEDGIGAPSSRTK